MTHIEALPSPEGAKAQPATTKVQTTSPGHLAIPAGGCSAWSPCPAVPALSRSPGSAAESLTAGRYRAGALARNSGDRSAGATDHLS